MDLQFELNADQLRQREEMIESLNKNPLVQRFLKQNNLDSSFLEENASYFQEWLAMIDACSKCAGIEFCTSNIKGKIKQIYIDEFGYISERYQSCKKYSKVEKEIEHKHQYRLSHLSQNDYLIDLHKIDLTKETSEYILPYTKVMQSLADEKGVYLFGQPGVGKSYLMCGVANYYAKNKKRVSYVKVPLLIQDIKQWMDDNEYRQTLLGHLRFSEVLVLDDIGSESITAWTRDEILFPVLDYRMNHHLKTYFTSNYTMEELEKQYRKNDEVASLRLMERIRTLASPVGLLGPSRR